MKPRGNRRRIFLTLLFSFLLFGLVANAWGQTISLAGTSGLTVTVQVTCPGGCSGISIDWGDSSSWEALPPSSPVTRSHTYGSNGTYCIQLICFGEPCNPCTIETGCSGSSCLQVNLLPLVDVTPPIITITSPTSSPTYTTSSPVITLGGTASDNVGLTQVTWANNRGGNGTAAGTTAWTAAGITLQSGSNVITVTAHDAAGNTGTDTITVTYTPPGGAAFSVTPSPSSSGVVPGQRNVIPVIYTASAPGGASFTATSSQGRFVTASGSQLGTINQTIIIRLVNGNGMASESVIMPASVIAMALRQKQNRIYYERTFTHGSDTATTRVALQVVPASAGPFSLVKMELVFVERTRRYGAGGMVRQGRATVPRNSTSLKAVAHISYNGAGLLLAQWKVDGQVLGYVSQYLYAGTRDATIESPEVPGLPTYDTGRHSVELEITQPTPPFQEPVIYYYVTQEAGAGTPQTLQSLKLISPVDKAATVLSAEPGNETTFAWEPLPVHCTYLFEILPAPYHSGTPPVVRARTVSVSYALSAMEAGNLEKGVPYTWHVKAFVNRQLVGESPDRTVYFTSPGSASGNVRFQYLHVIEKPAGPESLLRWFMPKRAHAAETGGQTSLFIAKPGQELLIQAGIKNGTTGKKTNIRVEFVVDGEIVDATFITTLAPGEMKEVEGLYKVSDDKTHTLEVRAIEGEGTSATILASIGGEITGVAREGAEMRAGEASPSRPIIPTSPLVMTGLTPGRRIIHTPTLEMTGLTSGRRIIHTPALEMTALAPGRRIIHTPTLEMTGLTPGRRVIHTPALEMTGIGSQPNEMRQVGPTRMENSGSQVLNLRPAGTNPTTHIPLSSLSIVQPNGGEVWRSGRSYGVLWRNRNFHEDIRIRLLGTDGRYNRVLYRSISADLGRAMVRVPPDVPTGNYKMSVESLDHAVHDESNGAFTIRGIGGFTAPDFQILDIHHLVNPERIAVHIRNNGIPWHGPVVFRIVYHDPDGPYSETRNATLDLILGAGESKWIDIINPFRWQDPLNMPRLVFLAQVDPDGQIAEFDEGNNQFQKEIALPCGLHISGLSHSWLYKGPDAQIFLYGTFGSERKSKTVGVLDEENHLYKVFPREWQPGSLEADLQNFPAGLYRFVVYCSDPDSGSAYASNISSWVEIRRPENHSGGGLFPSESPVEAGRIAGALSDEFVPAGTNAQVRIQRIWIEHAPDGWKVYASIHGALSVFLEQVVFEIWKDAERIRYGEVSSFHMTSSGDYEESFIFQGLHDGAYTLKCKILDTGGSHNEASLGFILSGTQVQVNN